jgi:hypothetical protein
MNALMVATLLLAPQTPPLETGSGYEFAVPKGWTRPKEGDGKATLLVPAGAKGDVRLVLYPLYAVENGTYANENHFHVAMLNLLTEAGERQGEEVEGRTGAFRWSRVKFVAGGAEFRVAAYTAKLRAHWALVAFAAPPAAFETQLPVVEQFVKDLKRDGEGKPVAAGAAVAHGLSLPLPEGWTRKDNPQGAVEFHPAPPKTDRDPLWTYVVLVLPTQALRGSFWESHRAIFDEVVQASGLRKTVAPQHEPDAPGPFVRSSTAGDDVNGSVRPVRLYSARSEGGIDCVVVFRQEDFAVTGAMLHHATVRKPPPASARPRLAGAWRRFAQQTHVEHVRGEQLILAVPYDRIWLRSDGLADFTPIYREGYAASRVPDKTGPGLVNGRFGSWTESGNEVRIVRRSDRPEEVYVRDGARLRLGDKVYEPMLSVDGLKLEGRWQLPGADRKRRIEFTAAGRFTDDGLLEDVGFLPVPAWAGSRETLYARPPAAGAGTYEIRDFTLLLTYDDGRLWSADFSIHGDDPKDLSKLLLKTGVLHRETP